MENFIYKKARLYSNLKLTDLASVDKLLRKKMQTVLKAITNLSSKVFQNGSTVHCCSSTNSSVACSASLQVSMYTTHRELKQSQKSH